ncbi:MAG: hypothetical protein HYY37_06640 [Candidatus Aenigmarchaeota archaeon]|nr:hypothetical protein [Candidatus Aenigmarchaeota archaeon]
MAVVRLDDHLLEEIKKFLEKDDNKYRYPSVSAFLNFLVYEKMKELNGKRDAHGKAR